MGNRIGFVFYGISVSLILVGIVAIPVVYQALEVPFGELEDLRRFSSFIRDHIGFYLGAFALCLVGFLFERVVGFGDWTFPELRYNWRYLPQYIKIPLLLFFYLIVFFNIEFVVVFLWSETEIWAKGYEHYQERISPWLHVGLMDAPLSLINTTFLVMLSVVFLVSHLNAPIWRRIKGVKEVKTARPTGPLTMRLSEKDRKRLIKAERYMEKGRLSKAAREFEALGEEMYYRAGKIYSDLGREDKASNAFLKAGHFFIKKSNFARAGDAYYYGGHWLKAIQAYERCSPKKTFLNDQDRIREWATRWGESLFALGRYQEAGNHFHKYGFDKKAGEAFERAEMPTRAAESYGRAGAYESSVKALSDSGLQDEALLEKGRFLLKQERYLEAGETFEKGGRLEQAIDAYNRAQAPGKAARCYFNAGKPELAVELFISSGEEVRALECYEKMGDYANAAKLAAHFGFQDKQAYYFRKAGFLIAAARSYLMIGDLGGAVSCFREVPLEDEDNVFDCAQTLNILYEQGRLDEALACAKGLMVDAKPSRSLAPLFFRYALILYKTGEISRAYDYMSQIANLVPEKEQYSQEAKKMAATLGETFVPQPRPAEKLFQTKPLAIPSKKVRAIQTETETQLPAKAVAIERSAVAEETTQTLDEETIYDITQDGALKRYQVIKKLGKGGMGFVYKALDKKLKRFVALKILHPEYNNEPRVVLFFKREAMAIASLNHPNLVHLFDMGKERGCFYMVMEYVEGHTLKGLLERYPKFLHRNLIAIWFQASMGLNYAHENGIIHRDLKPSNIMWTRDHRAKILDFGLAKEITDSSQTQQIWGTPSFMAPELFHGGRANVMTDIYGLGATFYMLATRRAPFSNENATQKFTGSGLPRPPHQLNPKIPRDLSKTILKCMHLSPANRFQTMDELMERIKKIGRKK